MLDSDSARDALIREILTEHYVQEGFLSPRLLDDLEEARPVLEILVEDLIGEHPHVIGMLDDNSKDVLRFGIYHTIIGYGDKKRKLGDHHFFNHPFRAAQLRVALAEKIGETDPLDLVPQVLILLAHDLVEEQVSSTLKEEKKNIQQQTLDEIGAKRVITDLESAAENMRLSLPQDVDGLPSYEQRYRGLISRERSREKLTALLSNSDLREQRLKAYFDALRQYVPRLREKVIQREKTLIQEELQRYRSELTSGMEKLGASRAVTRRIFRAVQQMTRVGSELYYESVGKLFFAGTLDAQVAKYLDRLANTLDVDHQGTLRFCGEFTFDYFWYKPEQRRVNLSSFLDAETSSKGLEQQARLLFSQDEGRDLLAILSVPLDAEQTPGIRMVDRLVYYLTDGNREHQKPTSDREGRAEVKTQLRPHERLYQLYKNIILITQDRKYHAMSRTPEILLVAQQHLLEATLKEARRMVEQTFAYHCHLGSNFTLRHARQAYQSLQHYEERGGLDEVTAVSSRVSNGEFSYDGVFERYFDQRVQGRKSAIDPLFHQKRDLFATALALHRLTAKYLDDPKFFLEGVHYHRLQLAEAIER